MSFFGQPTPNAWYGNGPNPANVPHMTLGQTVGNHHELIHIPQFDKSATECFTSLWLAHLTANGGNHLHNLKNRWPWSEPDDDPEFIAFMAQYGIEIPVRTLEQRLIPMEDA